MELKMCEVRRKKMLLLYLYTTPQQLFFPAVAGQTHSRKSGTAAGLAAVLIWSLADFLLFDVPKTFGEKYAKVRYSSLLLPLGAVLPLTDAAVLPLEQYCRSD